MLTITYYVQSLDRSDISTYNASSREGTHLEYQERPSLAQRYNGVIYHNFPQLKIIQIINNARHFVKTAGSLPCLQQQKSESYSETFPPNPHPQNIRYILILSLHLRLHLATDLCSIFSNYSSIYISLNLRACHMPRQSHSP
jgi:hypothetical protein